MSAPASRAKSANPPLTQDALKKALRYDPDTGVFTRLNSRSKKAASLIGKRAGTVNALGYRMIGIEYIVYLEHQIAWLYMTGEWTKEIDHRDRDKANNKWANLRKATRAQNIINRDIVVNNTTGYTGVSRSGSGYRAYITVDGRTMHLGSRPTAVDASALRIAAEQKFYGEFSSQ